MSEPVLVRYAKKSTNDTFGKYLLSSNLPHTHHGDLGFIFANEEDFENAIEPFRCSLFGDDYELMGYDADEYKDFFVEKLILEEYRIQFEEELIVYCGNVRRNVLQFSDEDKFGDDYEDEEDDDDCDDDSEDDDDDDGGFDPDPDFYTEDEYGNFIDEYGNYYDSSGNIISVDCTGRPDRYPTITEDFYDDDEDVDD